VTAVAQELHRAEMLLARDQPEEAIHLLESLTKRTPPVTEALPLLAAAYQEAGDLGSMALTLEQYLRIAPQSPDAAEMLLNIAGAYTLNQYPALAVRTFHRFLDRFPEHPEAGSARAMMDVLAPLLQQDLLNSGVQVDNPFDFAAQHEEAQIYLALALDTAASPADKTYANQLKAAAILEGIFKRQPQHPGVAHYLIHSYDYPPIADKGLDAATRYSKIAPTAPHAQHMPSHIFTRVGYWKESIAANSASVRAAKADKEYGDQLHGQDYMVYAYLQLAQDKNARAVIDEMAAGTAVNPDLPGASFALAASPARYAMERGDWSGAAALEVRPSKFLHVMAITHFARAVGAARLGKPDAAKADIAKLAELRDKLREAKDAYWAEQVDIQWQTANAWLLYAQGKYDEALAAMAAAAAAEDKTEKSPVTPGPIVPARELYGAMLLERGKAKDALAAFEATLKKEPHRLGATLGAAKAAEQAGDAGLARQYYAAAVALGEAADPVRPEITAARAFVTKVN
jgi:tetratricopeptide (TPR) repeat protein